jgi:hypothetical protein
MYTYIEKIEGCIVCTYKSQQSVKMQFTYVVECFEVTCSLPAGDVGTCTPYSENAV